MDYLNKKPKLSELINFIYSDKTPTVINAGRALGLGDNMVRGCLLTLNKAEVVTIGDNEDIKLLISDIDTAKKELNDFLRRNELYQKYESSQLPFNELLKEATKLKKAKKYTDAYDLLRATLDNASKDQFIEPRVLLRLPMYLELNWDFNGALDECVRLLNKSNNGDFRVTEEKDNAYTSPFLKFDNIFTNLPVLSKMSSILEILGHIEESLFYQMVIYISRGKYYCDFIDTVTQMADDIASDKPLEIELTSGEKIFLSRVPPHNKKPFAYTKKGSPIHDIAYNHMLKSRNEHLSISNIRDNFRASCNGLHIDNALENIAQKTKQLIKANVSDQEWHDDLRNWFNQAILDVNKNKES